MKILLSIMFTASLLLPVEAQQPRTSESGDKTFIEANTWWNLFFAKDNDPLKRPVHAVKVLEIDQRQRSWIKIAFPKSREEHFSIFRPAAKAHDNDAIAIEEALAKWEETISDWKVMWVNLDYVVYVTRVDPDDPVNVGLPEKPRRSKPIRSETK